VDFYERFDLLGLVRDGTKDGGVKTFEAREVATGRQVRVHLLFTPKAPMQAALLRAITQLPEREARRIIHRGKNEGTLYLVTERLAEYESLEDWVLQASQQPQPRFHFAPSAAKLDQSAVSPKPTWKHN
jgi:hypothetical protein